MRRSSHDHGEPCPHEQVLATGEANQGRGQAVVRRQDIRRLRRPHGEGGGTEVSGYVRLSVT